MKNLIFSLLLLLSFNANAQIDTQYLHNIWINVHTCMADGSRYIAEDSNKVYQLIFVDGLMVTNENLAFNRIPLGLEYKIENNFLRISPYYGYFIEKLTKDSFILIEWDKNIPEKDKLRKTYFLPSAFVFKQYKEKFKNDLVVKANRYYTPLVYEDKLLKRFDKIKYKSRVNFMIYGNLILFPKLNKVEFEVIKLENASKFEKEVADIVSKLESSYNDWDVTGFENFEKVYIPCSIEIGDYFSNLRIIFFPEPNSSQEAFNERWKKNDLSKKYFKKGYSALKKKKYKEAISHFEKSYEIDFSNLDALYNIAACYTQIGDAENLCKTLLKLKDLGQTEGTKLYNENCIPM